MHVGIGHVAYRVRDMEKTLAFYTEILGFKHAFTLVSESGEKRIEYMMAPDGRFIEFFYPDKAQEVAETGTVADGTGYMHICLEVDNCAAAVKELEAKGIAITKPFRLGSDGNYQAWIRDPDGRDIELMEINPEGKQGRCRKGL